MSIDKWIFVTGAPRSGTTFVGKVLSLPISVDYIHEPFNPDCGMPGIDQRYLYIPEHSESSPYDQDLNNLTNYRFHLKTGFFRNDSWKRKMIKRFVGSRGPFHLRLAKLNPFHTAAVLKDPIACLLTGYLAKRAKMLPILLVRHPVGFVASVKRLNWEIDLSSLTSQNELLDDYFSVDELTPSDVNNNIEKAAILWRALNKVILTQAGQHPDWKVLKHEDLASSPLETFRSLFDYASLEWSAKVENYILRKTKSGTPFSINGKTQQFDRDSSTIFSQSLNYLSQHERSIVYEKTYDIAESYYQTETFEL